MHEVSHNEASLDNLLSSYIIGLLFEHKFSIHHIFCVSACHHLECDEETKIVNLVAHYRLSSGPMLLMFERADFPHISCQ